MLVMPAHQDVQQLGPSNYRGRAHFRTYFGDGHASTARGLTPSLGCSQACGRHAKVAGPHARAAIAVMLSSYQGDIQELQHLRTLTCDVGTALWVHM